MQPLPGKCPGGRVAPKEAAGRAQSPQPHPTLTPGNLTASGTHCPPPPPPQASSSGVGVMSPPLGARREQSPESGGLRTDPERGRRTRGHPGGMSRAAQCGHWPRALTPQRSPQGLRDSAPTLVLLYAGLPLPCPPQPPHSWAPRWTRQAGRWGDGPGGCAWHRGSLHLPRGVHGGQVRTRTLPEGGSPEAGPRRWAGRSGEGLPGRWKGGSPGVSALEGEAGGGVGQPFTIWAQLGGGE